MISLGVGVEWVRLVCSMSGNLPPLPWGTGGEKPPDGGLGVTKRGRAGVRSAGGGAEAPSSLAD